MVVISFSFLILSSACLCHRFKENQPKPLSVKQKIIRDVSPLQSLQETIKNLPEAPQNHQKACFGYLKNRFFGGEILCFSWLSGFSWFPPHMATPPLTSEELHRIDGHRDQIPQKTAEPREVKAHGRSWAWRWSCDVVVAVVLLLF